MRRPMNPLWLLTLATLLAVTLLGAALPRSKAVAPAQAGDPTATVAACTPAATTGPRTPTPAACALYECCERNGDAQNERICRSRGL